VEPRKRIETKHPQQAGGADSTRIRFGFEHEVHEIAGTRHPDIAQIRILLTPARHALAQFPSLFRVQHPGHEAPCVRFKETMSCEQRAGCLTELFSAPAILDD